MAADMPRAASVSVVALRVTAVTFTAATPVEQARGNRGWVRVRVNDALELDGIRVRETRDGRLALAFPSRRDAKGRRHYLARPVSDAARTEIERQVIEILRRERKVAS